MKVEFLLTDPLLVSHAAPVLKALAGRGVDAAFVAEPRHSGIILFERSMKLAVQAAALEAARASGVPTRTAIDPDADVALTAPGSHILHLYRRIKLKFRYGVGLHKGFHYCRESSGGFDGLLAHGPFEADRFAEWIPRDRTRVMGSPRHDAYFANPTTQEEARGRLLPDGAASRKVVAYFPTWDEHGSLERCGSALAEISRAHRLLIKPHSMCEFSPRARSALQNLARAGAHVLRADAVFADVVAAADIIISDAKSGATAESLLLAPGTPLITLTDLPMDEFFPELLQAGPCIAAPEALARGVDALLEHDDFAESRRLLGTRLFGAQRGANAELAADGVLDLATVSKRSSAPGRLERAIPSAFRVARGQGLALVNRALAVRRINRLRRG